MMICALMSDTLRFLECLLALSSSCVKTEPAGIIYLMLGLTVVRFAHCCCQNNLYQLP